MPQPPPPLSPSTPEGAPSPRRPQAPQRAGSGCLCGTFAVVAHGHDAVDRPSLPWGLPHSNSLLRCLSVATPSSPFCGPMNSEGQLTVHFTVSFMLCPVRVPTFRGGRGAAVVIGHRSLEGARRGWCVGGVWHKASVSDCLPLAAPIGLSPLLILTLCGSERVLVVSTEPPDDLSCLTTPGVGRPGDGLLPVPLTRCIVCVCGGYITCACASPPLTTSFVFPDATTASRKGLLRAVECRIMCCRVSVQGTARMVMLPPGFGLHLEGVADAGQLTR